MRPHYEDERIVIFKFVCGPLDNNAYLVVCPTTNESIVIDTPEGADALVEAARATRVRAVLITHNHSDHLAGFDAVVGAVGAPVAIGEADAHALPRPAGFFLTDGRRIQAGTLSLQAIATPGHTPGSTCLLAGKHLFTGDTLFPGGPGRTSTPDALRRVINSITGALFTLDDATVFYPGHGADGDLGSARRDYRVFASKGHPPGLCGDVEWLAT